MPSKSKALSNSELAKNEATRDLGAELLQSVCEMKAGHVQAVSSPVIEARKKTDLSQSHFCPSPSLGLTDGKVPNRAGGKSDC